MYVGLQAIRPLLSSPLPRGTTTLGACTPQPVDAFIPTAHAVEKVEAPKKLDVDADGMMGDIQRFIDGLPGRVDDATALHTMAATGELLAEGRVLYERNHNYVPMQIIATAAKVGRAEAAADLAGGIEQEHLNVPLANFGVVADGRLYRGGQPSRAGLAWLAQHGVKTVVSLRRRDVEDFYGYVDFKSSEEAAACREAGMQLVEIPITDNAVPTREHVERFLRVMADPESGPVYVHCAAGAGRTGVMCGIFERQQGVPMAQVEKDLEHHYMDPKSPHGRAQLEFVRSYPITRPQPDVAHEWILR